MSLLFFLSLVYKIYILELAIYYDHIFEFFVFFLCKLLIFCFILEMIDIVML